MTSSHATVRGDSVYGNGTYIDKTVIPAPDDARRVFEYLASITPGFTKDREVWDTVGFEGGPDPLLPGPIKAPVVASALHAMCGIVANELLELRDGKRERCVTVDTDHAGIWLGSTFTTYIDGLDVVELALAQKLSGLFDRSFEQGFARGVGTRTTAIYPTKDPNVWYQLHGSLDANKTLESMGIPTKVFFPTMEELYNHIRKHVLRWSPDELEMHNIRHGLCGSICYTPEGWRKTEMGKALRKHPLINYTHESYATATPPIRLQKLPDRRPLAGIKVLEMVRIIAGPTIGVTLASYGADVIRVNCSKLIDLNVLQLTLNAGKRTVDLDIRKPQDMERLHELLADADVFIQGYRYGSLERKGLGLHDLLKLAGKRNKGIIYVDENCYGPDGPYASRPGWQQIGDAASGLAYVMGRSFGYNKGECALAPLPISDMTTGVVAALGTMMAIRDRATKGGSYHVVGALVAADAILLEPEIGLYPPEVVEATAEKFRFVPHTPDQFVSEIMVPVVDGWKRVFPGHLDESSPYMTTFVDGHWGHQRLLNPVVQLDDQDATPRWTSPPVPNCHHSRDIGWREHCLS